MMMTTMMKMHMLDTMTKNKHMKNMKKKKKKMKKKKMMNTMKQLNTYTDDTIGNMDITMISTTNPTNKNKKCAKKKT